MSEELLELQRLANLLRMIADTARLAAKRYPDSELIDIEGVASEIDGLAGRLDNLRPKDPDVE